MTTAEFLSHVRDLGINLWLDGDDLHYSAPKGALTQDLRAELVERKAEILVFLRKTQAVALPSQADEAKPELTKTFVAPRTPTEETLAEIWAQVLGVEQVGIHDNFFELGGDSLLGMQVINSANQAGLRFVPRQLLEHQTIAELAAVEGTVVVQAEQGVITGPVPLLPIQHIVLRDHSADPDHSDSIIHLLEAQQTLDPVLVEKVVRQLLVHHDALRLRFVRKGSGWHQFIAAPDEEVPFSCIDLSVLPEKHQSPAIEAASVELQACMDLSRSPLQIALFDLGADRPSRLLIIVHHLVTDGYSQQILLHDLETAYRRLSRGEETQLPTKTTSYKHWADRLRGYATSSNIRQELVYWCWLAESCRQISCLPVDYPEGVNTQASLRHLRLSLSVEETSVLLREIPKYDARIIDALLTALGETFARWSGERLLSVMFVSHGREALFADVDLSRTIGYFATHHPLFLDLRQASNLADVLRLVREQIRCIPNCGVGYGLLHYLSGDAGIAQEVLVTPQVLFNYVGFRRASSEPSESLLKPAKEAVRSWRGQHMESVFPYLFQVTSGIWEDQLELDWMYSEHLYHRFTIEKLTQFYLETLQALIAHCQSLRGDQL